MSAHTDDGPAREALRDVWRQHWSGTLTPAMLRELRAIARTGEQGDLYDYVGAGVLAFHAREKVLNALTIRRLIVATVGGFSLTDAGRAALAEWDTQ